MKGKLYDVAVIGAGAAGLMAAITAARVGAQVLILDHAQEPGKKLLMTGNGHCNYTNLDMSLTHYYCEDRQFLHSVLGQFDSAAVIAFFAELGIRPTQKYGTCVYPESEQASSVREVLLMECSRLHITMLQSIGIRGISKQSDVFFIETKSGFFQSSRCILATGGTCFRKTGSDGSGYLYVRALGHTITPQVPALVPLVVSPSRNKLPQGVRIHSTVTLTIDDAPVAAETGELQITAYGISGIVVFQLSRIASRGLEAGRRVAALLDFKPDSKTGELEAYLAHRFSGAYMCKKTMADAMTGFVPDKMIPVLLQHAGISMDMPCVQCDELQLRQFVKTLKEYRVEIEGTKGFEQAQATAGGVVVSEINPQTMESQLVRGLYFAGEIVDVDGICGGYNLQWAWASGHVAGLSAAGRQVQ